MTVSEKLRKAISNFTVKHSPMSQEEQLKCAEMFLSSSLAYSSLHRYAEELDTEMQLIVGLKWLTMQYSDAPSNVLGASDFTVAVVKMLGLKVQQEQITVNDAVDSISVLLTGVIMMASTTDNVEKKRAQCDAIAEAIRKTAITEMTRIYGKIGEMN